MDKNFIHISVFINLILSSVYVTNTDFSFPPSFFFLFFF